MGDDHDARRPGAGADRGQRRRYRRAGRLRGHRSVSRVRGRLASGWPRGAPTLALTPPGSTQVADGPDPSGLTRSQRMLCAAIDIGSNTTRVLVAEPQEGQLHKVMEQRAYTRIGKGSQHDGAIDADKVGEVADVVATQIRLAKEVGAEAIRTVATAAIREAANRTEVVAEIARVSGVEVEVLSEHEEGRLAFIGATKTLGHPVEGDVAVVDVGGGSSEVVVGSIAEGLRSVQSFKIGSGSLADDFLSNDPPSPAELRAVREHIAEFFDGVDFEQPGQAVAVGGSATSLRTLVGAVLEYETLERAV